MDRIICLYLPDTLVFYLFWDQRSTRRHARAYHLLQGNPDQPDLGGRSQGRRTPGWDFLSALLRIKDGLSIFCSASYARQRSSLRADLHVPFFFRMFRAGRFILSGIERFYYKNKTPAILGA